MRKILIADDENSILTLLEYHFTAANFDVLLAHDGQEALDLARTEKFDLLLLDVMMPKFSGIELIKILRKEKNYTPILILTARDDEEMRLSGLDSGADDYLDKTTDMKEIVIRAKGLIRRAQDYGDNGVENFTLPDIEVDFQKKTVKLEGSFIDLTKREFDILEYLIRRQGQIVSRDALLQSFWGVSNADVETRTIDVLVGRLRKKLNNRFIKSKRGYGYIFDENA
ncbi:response regulator transcription factor [Lactovum miscens]|uniref:Transcriptional regulatory protein DltR n=1 Tax=Lactovum miscens TaxID=190387 RepID=A0A841C7K8_9LACT|nr:response regulator transcription factor [Lactovum miscens]MBB5887541.1 DNA-binding response OmpR family regulator [Lactovum miscens]